MAEAKEALERLSDDPAAQRLAERRREAELELERFGLAERKQGHVERARLALLDVLAARGFTPNEQQRERIDACFDVGVLARWTRRAVTAESVSVAFDDQ